MMRLLTLLAAATLCNALLLPATPARSVSSARAGGVIRLEAEDAGAAAFSAEELAALFAASTSKDPAWKGGAKGEMCPPALANAFTRPAILFSLLRNPTKDPPEEVWECIRAQVRLPPPSPSPPNAQESAL